MFAKEIKAQSVSVVVPAVCKPFVLARRVLNPKP